jgi:hypothetical protein
MWGRSAVNRNFLSEKRMLLSGQRQVQQFGIGSACKLVGARPVLFQFDGQTFPIVFAVNRQIVPVIFGQKGDSKCLSSLGVGLERDMGSMPLADHSGG